MSAPIITGFYWQAKNPPTVHIITRRMVNLCDVPETLCGRSAVAFNCAQTTIQNHKRWPHGCKACLKKLGCAS